MSQLCITKASSCSTFYIKTYIVISSPFTRSTGSTSSLRQMWRPSKSRSTISTRTYKGRRVRVKGRRRTSKSWKISTKHSNTNSTKGGSTAARKTARSRQKAPSNSSHRKTRTLKQKYGSFANKTNNSPESSHRARRKSKNTMQTNSSSNMS